MPLLLRYWYNLKEHKIQLTLIFQCRLHLNHHHYHHHLSLNREGRLGTTGDFATSFLLFSLFSTALWDLANSWPVHSLMLSSPPLLLSALSSPPFHCALHDGFGQTRSSGLHLKNQKQTINVLSRIGRDSLLLQSSLQASLPL